MEKHSQGQRRKRLLAISSPGGHWVQLRLLDPAWHDHEVVYACAGEARANEVAPARYHAIPDASRRDLRGLWHLARALWRVMRIERPDVVVTTGAAPGGLAILIGRLFRARTVWIDSVANAERLSLSGRVFGRIAHKWLTQWPHLARPEGPEYLGAVL
ncbi:MAG: hypothetical protein IT457_23090 [Planctomycetes bacterium]|nr:hypothetical protein [Planctomycetota bacterium]